jgi:hypothetical protein
MPSVGETWRPSVYQPPFVNVKLLTSITHSFIEEFRHQRITLEFQSNDRGSSNTTQRQPEKDKEKPERAAGSESPKSKFGKDSQHDSMASYTTMTQRKENHVLLHVVPVKVLTKDGNSVTTYGDLTMQAVELLLMRNWQRNWTWKELNSQSPLQQCWDLTKAPSFRSYQNPSTIILFHYLPFPLVWGFDLGEHIYFKHPTISNFTKESYQDYNVFWISISHITSF